jgi:hypothetical protein
MKKHRRINAVIKFQHVTNNWQFVASKKKHLSQQNNFCEVNDDINFKNQALKARLP